MWDCFQRTNVVQDIYAWSSREFHGLSEFGTTFPKIKTICNDMLKIHGTLLPINRGFLMEETKYCWKLFYSKIQNNKFFQTSPGAVWCALSDETAFKIFYDTNPTNLPYLRRHAFDNIVYHIDPKKLFDSELLIPWKDSPSSIASTVKKSLWYLLSLLRK
jgi:hypothetical protein